MKPRNKRIYSTDLEYLTTLRIEYGMLGFDTLLEDGCLTVFSRKRNRARREKKSKKKSSRGRN